MWVNDLPVLLHVDNRPVFRLCFVEAFVQATNAGFSVVGPFALAIGVVDVERKSRSLSGSGPFQHLQVSVGIAERCDRATADVLIDSFGACCHYQYLLAPRAILVAQAMTTVEPYDWIKVTLDLYFVFLVVSSHWL